MAQSSLSRLAAEDEEMKNVVRDVHKLNAALNGSHPAHSGSRPNWEESLMLDQAIAKIEDMKVREVMLLEQKTALENTVAMLLEGNAQLEGRSKSSSKSPTKVHAAQDMQAQLEVENAALRQHVRELTLELGETGQDTETHRQLTITSAVLQNKYAALQRQHSILQTKFEKLQGAKLVSTDAL